MSDRKNSAIYKRNINIKTFFSYFGINIRLVGDPKNPNFIENNEYRLPCVLEYTKIAPYCKLSFKDGFEKNSNPIAYSIDFSVEPNESVKECMASLTKRDVFRIKYGNDLFLHSFKYSDIDRKMQQYPIFSREDPKIIFTKNYAISIINQLVCMGYDNISLV
jgi:hypothetical protein